MLRNLTAKEYLLFLFAKGQRPKLAHTIFANHRTREFRCTFDIVRGTGSDLAVAKINFLSDAPAHQYRDLAGQVFAGVAVTVAFGQLLSDTKRHSTRND